MSNPIKKILANITQLLSNEEKAQARDNIGAASASDLTAESSARSSADTSLGNAISAEESRAKAAEVGYAEYDRAHTRIVFKTSQSATTELFGLDASQFIVGGIIDSIYISEGNLVISYTDSEGQSESVSIPISDIFDADNYYTKTTIDTLLSGKANSSHTHSISDVSNLQQTLNGKQNALSTAEDQNAFQDNSTLLTAIASSVLNYKKASDLWTYIKDKIASVLGLTASYYGGRAATAGSADYARNATDATYASNIGAYGATAPVGGPNNPIYVGANGNVLPCGGTLYVNISGYATRSWNDSQGRNIASMLDSKMRSFTLYNGGPYNGGDLEWWDNEGTVLRSMPCVLYHNNEYENLNVQKFLWVSNENNRNGILNSSRRIILRPNESTEYNKVVITNDTDLYDGRFVEFTYDISGDYKSFTDALRYIAVEFCLGYESGGSVYYLNGGTPFLDSTRSRFSVMNYATPRMYSGTNPDMNSPAGFGYLDGEDNVPFNLHASIMLPTQYVIAQMDAALPPRDVIARTISLMISGVGNTSSDNQWVNIRTAFAAVKVFR